MNAVTEQQDLNEVHSGKATSIALIFDKDTMQSVMAFAKIMASSTVTVPKHLQGKEADCMAVVIQSMNWGMNPFAVAQKTHLVNGVLGYEAQLVNAVVQSNGFIRGSFHYEYTGEKDNICCRVGAVLKNQTEITWGEWLNAAHVTTKNSPVWKTNPKQQLGYLQVKNWARAYTPSAILGVYTKDELEAIPMQEVDITPKNEPEAKKEPVYYTDEEFLANENGWKKVIANGKAPDRFIAFIETKGKLFTASQKEEVMLWGAKPAVKPVVVEGVAVEVQDDFVTAMNQAESEQ